MYVRSSRICLGFVALLGLTVAVCAHATPRSDEDRAIQRAAVARCVCDCTWLRCCPSSA